MNTSSAKIGYARTSTTDQNLDAQITALKAAGCGMVRTEQKSGATLNGRPELKTRGTIADIHDVETAEKVATICEYSWHRDRNWDPFAKFTALFDRR